MNPQDADDSVRLKADTTSALADGLRALAEDDEQLGASNAVGLRLLAEVQAIADARRRRTMLLSLAAAATLATVLAVPAWRSLQSRPNLPTATDGAVVTRELVTEFFPLRYSNVPARGGYVVRMQVPRTALASFGATAPAGISNDPNILADVVVGDDGLARAVRFVQVIHDDQQEQTP
ncbi:MAG: hypothetical protein ACRD3G_28300 [Vicinamibacterales bacterium]